MGNLNIAQGGAPAAGGLAPTTNTPPQNALAPSLTLTPALPGFAIAALNPTCQANLFSLTGNGNLIIQDGGVLVNAPPGCEAISFASSNVRLATSTTAACPDVNLPPTQSGGCYINGAQPLETSGAQTGGVVCASPTLSTPINWWGPTITACNLYPAVQTNLPQVLTPTAPISTTDFTCGPTRTTPAGGGTLLPGTYADGMNANSSATLTLTAGIYCITGVGSANRILRANSITGHEVFIYIAPAVAVLSVTGSAGSVLDLTPITNCETDPALCPLMGIVLYKPFGSASCAANAAEFSLSSQGDMSIRGLVWAPQSFLDYTGQGNLTMIGQTLVGCARYAKSESTSTIILYENLRSTTYRQWLPWVRGNPAQP